MANYGQTPSFGGCCVSGSSVTEVAASSGALIGVHASADFIEAPSAIAVSSGHAWVANASDINGGGGSSLCELSVSSGSLVTIARARAYDFNVPSSMTYVGAHLVVTNFGSNTVTELSAGTGKLVRVFMGQTYGFNGPAAISTNGVQLWVVNRNGNSLTEFSAN